MLIKRVEIKNFRKLVGPLIIDGLEPGINVISGDNEEGKSTLLLALRAAFCHKHNASTQLVKSFQPYNSAVRPEVHVDFELHDGAYKISKGFVVKPHLAEFRSPRGKSEGSEAEEEIRKLFNMPAADKGKKEFDAGLWGLLWLDQATAEDGLRTSEHAKEGLTKLLERDLSGIVGGAQSRAVVRKIEEEYALYYTEAQGKERGDLRTAREKQEQAQLRHSECLERFEQFKRKSEQLADKQYTMEAHRRNKSIETAKKALDDADKLLQQLKQLRLETETVKKAEQVAKLKHESAAAKCGARAGLVVRLEKVQNRITELEELLLDGHARLLTAENTNKTTRVDLATTEAQLTAVEKVCTNLEQLEEQTRLSQQIRDNDIRIKALAANEQQLHTLSDELSAIGIDNKVVDKLRELEQSRVHAEIKAAAMTTRLVVRPEGTRTAFIDQKGLAPGEEIKLAKSTIVRLEGWGEIEVTPGGEDTQARSTEAEQAADKFNSALKKAKVISVKEAETLCANRAKLVSDIEHLKQSVAGTAGSESKESLISKNAVLQKQLDKVPQLSVEQHPGEGSPPTLSQVRSEREATTLKVKALRSACESELAQISKSQIAIAGYAKEKETATAQIAEINLSLTGIGSTEAMEKEAVADAELKLLLARKDVSIKTQELSALEKADVENQHKSAASKVALLDAEIRSLNDTITQLSAEINAAGDAGLGEELERFEGEKVAAVQEFRRVEQHARALKLLHETLTQAQQHAKEQFLEPVSSKLQPHLNELFKKATVAFEPELIEITHLARNGVDERYSDLSIGTREQISVLTRLAVAQLLHEQNQPSLVILDDALVYTDDSRMHKMKQILVSLSSDLQVIILTCKARDYQNWPGAKYLSMTSSLTQVAR